MRLIDADALLEHIKDVPTWWQYTDGWHPKKYPAGMYDPEDVIASIENAPTVDAVEVAHGRWQKAKYIEAPVYVCSECGNREPLPSNYCPECGCKMEG